MDIANEKIAKDIVEFQIGSGDRPNRALRDDEMTSFLRTVLSTILLEKSKTSGICNKVKFCNGIGCISLSHKLLFTYIKYFEKSHTNPSGYYLLTFLSALNKLRTDCNYTNETPFDAYISTEEMYDIERDLLKHIGYEKRKDFQNKAIEVLSAFSFELKKISDAKQLIEEANNHKNLEERFEKTFGNSSNFNSEFFTDLHDAIEGIQEKVEEKDREKIDIKKELENFLITYDPEKTKSLLSNQLTISFNNSQEYLEKFIAVFNNFGYQPIKRDSPLSDQIINLINQYEIAKKAAEEAAAKAAAKAAEAEAEKIKAAKAEAAKMKAAEAEAAKIKAEAALKKDIEDRRTLYLETNFKNIDSKELFQKIPDVVMVGNETSTQIYESLQNFVGNKPTINKFVQKIKENNKSDKLTDASELTKINDEDLKKYWIEVTSDRPNEVEVVTLFKQEYYNFREYVLERFYSIDDANKRKQLIDSFDSFVFLCHMLEFMHSNPTQGRKYIDIYKKLTFTKNEQIDEKNTTNAKKMFFHYLNRSLMADVSEGEQKLIKSACTQKF